MARYKSALDPMGGHARLYWKIIDSPAWQALGWAAQGIYVAMRRQLKASNNGNINATLSQLRHYGVKSSSTLAAALRAMETVGLIAKTRQGYIAAGGKVCNLYRFTDVPVHDHPKLGITSQSATNEWGVWKSLQAARAAIRNADALAKRLPERNVKPRKAKQADSKVEASAHLLGSNSEQIDASPIQKLKLATGSQS